MPNSPERTALYRLYANNGQLLYIGITTDPDARWARHSHSKRWWEQVAHKDVRWLKGNWADALEAEAEAIRTEQPTFNGTHNYPDVPFAADQWPAIHVRRGKAQALADRIREEIRSGRWATGARIPTRGEIAAASSVSKSTAALAYRVLQEDGLIWCLNGLGSFVSNGTPLKRPNHQRPQ